ncbi:capsular polysaccharide biosynthesis protein CpsC [Clostridia bacterium]|nr:capsular polysaccharide biosynthesis protein CpsC [Clostridia bacterium]
MDKKDELDEKYYQVNLSWIWEIFWHAKIILLICTLFGGFIAFAVSKYFMTPIYFSTTNVYILNSVSLENGVTSGDLDSALKLSKDYRKIVTSKKVLNQVKERLGLSGMEDEILGEIRVSSPVDTRVIDISVLNKNSILAADIANTLADVSSAEIINITKAEKVQVIDVAEPGKEPVSPNVIKNMLLGALAGLIFAAIGVLIKGIVDDRIYYPEDLEKYFSYQVLGVIPVYTKSETKTSKGRKGG